ncbi:uncharacterized oxidoreductase MexAM1_META1p0182 [Plutella xylostella]|uniref:uncharacterized oxidoreductase MexAM1_META1p0182 n=1 Tax=Plutella xylostella TaxID=51655 RepID=UPI002032DCFE|nr:uncharacterized oxidoreductase MexAM1_META1p0182 [Plutella xylostella]
MSFKDKVVIVTGASSGIGAAIAMSFAEQGASVVLVGRNQAKLDGVTSKCIKNGTKPLAINADVTTEADVKRIIDKTVQTFGQIDILINNAGIASTVSFGREETMKEFDRIMAVNFRAVVHLTQLATPHLIKTKGNIVNISSVASLRNFDKAWIYCSTKAALDHFSRSMASELAKKGVRVNTVNPGPVKTDIIVNMGLTDTDFYWDLMKGATALNRISDPSEIADVVLFLASEKAKGVTGSTWVTDNGTLVK